MEKCLFQLYTEAKILWHKNKNLILKESTSYVSLSDHPPIIDKKPLIGGESILHGNEQGEKTI